MPLTDQWQGFTGLPDFSDPPAIPTDLKATFDFLASRSIPRYASVAARDAELASPTDGQMAWVDADSTLYVHVGGWRALWTDTIAARRSGAAAITVPSGGTIAFDPGAFEYNYGMGGSGGAIVAPVGGIYTVTAGVRWSSGFTGVTQLRLVRNGADSIMLDSQSIAEGGTGSQHTNTIAGDLPLSAGDDLSLAIFQNSGADVDTGPNFGMPFFSITLQQRT